ncbi:alginate O-acetyltransferase AlgX-related protein [Xanthobacter sp. TB0139]|uniref:alginate O-acetyltransferase AlgX-related protein n=1 Tax=Xanthobacter sp. TB0139 TaxID=3459178 RepID=UPI00403A05D2
MKTGLPHKPITRRHMLGALGAGALAMSLSLPGATPAMAQGESIIHGKNGWLFPGWESLTTSDQAGIEAAAALIGDTSKALAARNIRLITIVAPLKARFHRDKLPDDAQISDAVEPQYNTIMAALKQQGVDVVDMRPPLKSVQIGKQTSFYRADYHWTAWAAEAAADAVASDIRISGVTLAGENGTGDKLGDWMTQRHYGDLAERFLTPDARKKVGPELFTVRVAPQQQAGLLDTAPAPVHVVGNSFVQPYLGFPQKLSSDIDRPVSLTWNPGNVGPWLTFLQYVESPGFKQNPPQFIVWLFNEGAFHSLPDNAEQWDSSSLMSAQNWRQRMQAAIGK